MFQQWKIGEIVKIGSLTAKVVNVTKTTEDRKPVRFNYMLESVKDFQKRYKYTLGRGLERIY